MTLTLSPLFFKVDPTGSHVTPLANDTGATAASFVDLLDLGVSAGDAITLQQTGDFNPGSSDSPFDDQTGLVAVFEGGAGPIGTFGNFEPYERGLVGGATPFNDIPEDFRVQSDGTAVLVPEGATRLLFATTDAFKGPNSDPDNDFGVLIALAPEDTVIFTDGDDAFDGGPAGDTVSSLAGNDRLTGNDGADRLNGGAGNDTLVGGNGRDTLNGGDGNDLLDGSQGDPNEQGSGDILRGGLGQDTLLGHQGHFAQDREGALISYADVSGIGGIEITVTDGSAGRGTITSRIGTAIESTFEFSRFFQGSADADIIRGGVDSQAGFAGLRGNDTLIGGSGDFDFLQYNDDRFEPGGDSGVTVDFNTGTATDGFGDTDTFSGMEQVRGSEQGDIVIGSDGNERMLGVGGNDTMSGGGGNDTLDGGDGNDVLNGGADNDTLRGGDGDDVLNPGSGSFDWLYPGAGNDTIDMRDAGAQDYAITFYNTFLAPITATFNVATGTGTVSHGAFMDTFLGLVQAANPWGFGIAGSQNDDTFNVTQIDGGFTYIQGQGGSDTYNIDLTDGGIVRIDFTFGDSGVFQGIVADMTTGVIVDAGGFTDQLNLTQGAGTFQLEASNFDDSIAGNDEDNHFRAKEGDDTLDGQGGDDSLRAGAGDDSVTGGDDDDTLDGGDGDDTLDGGAGDDVLIDGLGNDSILGGDGDDVWRSDTGEDMFDGGDGRDRFEIDLTDRDPQQFTVETNLATGENGAVDLPNGRDTLINVEDYRLIGDYDVIVTGSDADNHLQTDLGDDTLIGDRGDDTLEAGAGADTLSGGLGEDSLSGGDGDDLMRGNTGEDTLDGGAGDDQLRGQKNADLLDGGDGDDNVKGGGGNDTLFGGEGRDFLNGGTRRDLVEGGAGRDKLIGRSFDDTLIGGDGNDRLNAGGDDDRLEGGAGRDVLKGGAGADVFVFDTGFETDRVIDFDIAEDRLEVSAALAGGRDADGIAALASVTGRGVEIAFGDGDLVELRGLADTTGLAGQIDIV